MSVQAIDAADVFAVAPGQRGDEVGGGWIGYLSYPDAAADNRARGSPRPPAAGPTACCAWTATVAGGTKAFRRRTHREWVADALSSPRTRAAPYEIDWEEPDFEQHQAGVLACLAAIGAGEVYQACVCTQFAGTLRGSSLEFFADAVTRTIPARAAYLAGDWGAVASLSPELFVRRVGDE